MRLIAERRSSFVAVVSLVVLFCTACSDPGSDAVVLTAELPLHLEDHLDVATIEGSEVAAVRAERPQPVEWRFNEPQPDWTPTVPWNPTTEPLSLTRTEDALRVSLTEGTRNRNGNPRGGLELALPGWRREDWAYVVVRARTAEAVNVFTLNFNRRDGAGTATDLMIPYRHGGAAAWLVRDGAIRTYQLPVDRSDGIWEGPWRQLGLWFRADVPASIDILSISLIPKEANYEEAPAGTRAEARGGIYRNALYAHAPGRLAYPVRIPAAGRLDVGLGVLRDDAPVTFRVEARTDGGDTAVLFEETYKDKERWAQRSVDLSSLAGQTVMLGLATAAEQAGSVALWGAPTVTGSGTPSRPNVIFYVIDGGAADFMSVYGYNRRTTPNIERLAAEGVVFERAYSNSSWTRPSTASFMTSLHNSVMGGLLNWNDGVPEQAVTMAEHMHQAGYQTAVFTANPNAGTLSNLQRGVDAFRDEYREDFAEQESSRFLHDGFWRWREGYPAEPYWVHFQTTDVHDNFPAVSPFAGLFVSPEARTVWREWYGQLHGALSQGVYGEAYEELGISRTAYFSLKQGLYDETMAHNDYQLGRMVERLKAEGEWDNTLLIIGGDHSIRAAMDDMGIAIRETLPPQWAQPMFRPTISRVPLIVVWPDQIEGGRRFSGPVSMIDVLPTVLDLVGLPPAEVAQGQSLAPLLLGRDGWEPRPVILDEFDHGDPRTEELRGVIEVVDGQWGASLEINPDPEWPEAQRRPVPLLLYDLWNDPMCLQSVHDEHPDLVAKYTTFLKAQFEAHQALAQQFTPGEQSPLTPEQLQRLRALGYIR
jgi:arylsulfatase A-like enzyme